MVAINFTMFMAAIVDGRKCQTIRTVRKAGNPYKGCDLQLFTGQRTKNCRKLMDATCCAVVPISIDSDDRSVKVELQDSWVELDLGEIDHLASDDGFDSTSDFFDYFKESADRLVIIWGWVEWLDAVTLRCAKPTVKLEDLSTALEVIASVRGDNQNQNVVEVNQQ